MQACLNYVKWDPIKRLIETINSQVFSEKKKKKEKNSKPSTVADIGLSAHSTFCEPQ